MNHALAAVVLLLVIAPGSASASPVAERIQRFNAVENVWNPDETPEIRARNIARAYQALKHGIDVHSAAIGLATSDLQQLYKAARIAHFYSPSSEHALDMLALARELHAREASSSEQAYETYHALIDAREYSQARAWRSAQSLAVTHVDLHEPHLPALPHGQPVALSFTDGKREAHAFSFARGGQVIVVASPGCDFSQSAAAHLSTDRPLMAATKDRIIWLAPQQNGRALQSFLDWNSRFPAAPILQAYKNAAWPALENQRFPVFYFYRDGVLHTTITGWPQEGRMPELERALQAIGIVVPR